MDWGSGPPGISAEDSGIAAQIPKEGGSAYFIGIKGTGMCALAELMHKNGIHVSGSDTDEIFYTDGILREIGIPFYESFNAEHLRNYKGSKGSDACSSRPDLVIYSAAYSFETNPEMAESKKLGIPTVKYTDALGAYSAGFDSSGITGVHGKTTTTALAGAALKGAGIPAQVLAGSAVGSFGGRSTISMGNKYFVAETCEYRKHFLSFHPKRIVLTSVESDHQDYYPQYKDIRDAFLEYGRLLPKDGELIYCADNEGAVEVAGILKMENPALHLVPYGFSAEGDFRITYYAVHDERVVLRLGAFREDFILRIPGRHTAQNAAAAIALVSSIAKKEYGDNGLDGERLENIRRALEGFSGSKRRSEIIGEAGGILFMDDYGHHPTAIESTLKGLKEFYPKRRLIVSFMSHTYTRTAALLDEFAYSFGEADIIVLHKIYASAREIYHGGITGKTLFERTKDVLGGEGSKGKDKNDLSISGSDDADDIRASERFYYSEEPEDGVELLKSILKPGDLFITMGAGDNWKLGSALYKYYREKK